MGKEQTHIAVTVLDASAPQPTPEPVGEEVNVNTELPPKLKK